MAEIQFEGHNDLRAEESETHICNECERSFYVDDMLRFGDFWVCAECKPNFFMKLKQGIVPRGVMQYASFWTRATAIMIDQFILWIFFLIFLTPIISDSIKSASSGSYEHFNEAWLSIFYGITTIVPLIYNVWFVGRFGATPGKMLLKIHIVTANGGKLSYKRALSRYFAYILSSFTLGIGYLMAAIDDEKRSLHDRICDTRVVVK